MLPLKVDPEMASGVALSLASPPPSPLAELPEKVVPVIESVLSLKSPPPVTAELPLSVAPESESVAPASFAMPPPLAVDVFDPISELIT